MEEQERILFFDFKFLKRRVYLQCISYENNKLFCSTSTIGKRYNPLNLNDFFFRIYVKINKLYYLNCAKRPVWKQMNSGTISQWGSWRSHCRAYLHTVYRFSGFFFLMGCFHELSHSSGKFSCIKISGQTAAPVQYL